jgi:phosphoribosylamine--glycine ligase
MEGVRVYHAGTREQDGKIYTAGGRVLNVTGCGTTLSQALDRAYAAAEVIRFEGKDYRRDIGKKGLAKER